MRFVSGNLRSWFPIGIDDPCRRSGAVDSDLARVRLLQKYERGLGLVSNRVPQPSPEDT